METPLPPDDIDTTPVDTPDEESQTIPPPPDDGPTRFKPAIVFIAAVLLTISSVTYLVGWIDDRAGPAEPVAGIVVRGPDGRIEVVPAGTTVGETLEWWGEETEGLDEKELDERLTDGSVVTVTESDGNKIVTTGPMRPAELIALGRDFDINRATVADLALIPGIGEVSAKRVIDYRERHGPFGSANDLAAVPGLGPDRARILAARVTFGTGAEEEAPEDSASLGPAEEGAPRPTDKLTEADPPIDINAASLEELMRIPGVGEVTARRIIDYREKHGPYKKVADLENVEGIGEKKAERIERYVFFE